MKMFLKLMFIIVLSLTYIYTSSTVNAKEEDKTVEIDLNDIELEFNDTELELNETEEELNDTEVEINDIEVDLNDDEVEHSTQNEDNKSIESEVLSGEIYDKEALYDYALNIQNYESNTLNTSSNNWPFSSYPANVRTFINQHSTRAIEYANRANLFPSVMMAQAILESGWGSSSLSKPPYHQLFGIKGNNFSGSTVTMPTREWIVDRNHKDGGYYITINAEFRVYASYDQAFSDQTNFLTVNSRYRNVFRNQSATYRDATRALQSAGYATDPEYANKLNALIERWELHRLDGGINYQTHVESIGNTQAVRNGQTSGTVGSRLRLESIRLNLEDIPNSGIEYRTHVQTDGWQSWRSQGQLSGTTGESKRLEAIQIRLTGEAANRYDVYYRVHSEQFGWLGWAKNGEEAGTEGYRYRMEAIEVQLVSKGHNFGGSTSNAFRKAPTLVGVSTHVQRDGWQPHVRNGKFSGTMGQAKRLEGIKLRLENQEHSGGIRYRTHVQTHGWQDWRANDQTSGTSGQALRLEAIQIELTGQMANHYDVYYRTYIQSYGWLGWARNGEESGSEGQAKRLEAIEVVLVRKGGSAPGSTSRRYIQ